MTRLLLLLSLLWLPFAAAAQDDDRGFLQGLIEDNLSSAGREVRIEGFQGALSSRATIEELTIADKDGIWLTLRGAVLDWNRSALLRGRLEVNTLSADELIIPRLPVFEDTVEVPTAAAPGFALPDLPVSIEIGTLAIGRAELGEPLFGEAATISFNGTVSLVEGQGQAKLAIERIDGQRGSVTLDATYSNATQDLALDLSVSEEADGIIVNLANLPGLPSLDLSVDGTGTLNDFTADINLATDGVTRLAGDITLMAEPRGEGPPLRRFTADIGGDLAPVFTPEYRPFFGDDIRLNVRGARRPDGALNLEGLTLTADSITLEGQVAIGANGLPETVALTGQIANPAGGPVLLPVGADPIEVTRVDLEISFDAARGEAWGATVNLIGLDSEGLAASNVTLSGSGQIATDPDTGNRVTADLDFRAQGLDLGTPELTQALGTEIAGRADIDWQQGTAVRIVGLELAGAGLDLTGSGTLDIEGADLAVTGTAAASIEALAPFSGLAGRDLGGSLEARISGSGALLGGAFDVEATARGLDLKVSVPQADPLLAGQSSVELSAMRDETGLTIRRFTVQSPEVSARASGEIRAETGTLQAEARLREIAQVVPELSGPLEFSLTAQMENAIWQVDAQATGPGGASLLVDGRFRDLLTAPVFTGQVNADIGRLADYSDIARRDLGGAVSARLSGTGALSGSLFDLDLTMTSRDLKVGIPQADALLVGQATVELAASRAGAALTVDSLAIVSPQIDGTASGRYQPGDSAFKIDARLAEAGLVLPQLSGAVTLQGEGQEIEGGWDLDLRASGPGTAVASVDGTVTGLDTDPAFDGRASADIRDLSAYAAIAGRDLAGAVTARFSGSAHLNGERFNGALSMQSRDLAVGIPQADALLAGAVMLDVGASREGATVTVDSLAIEGPQVTGTASGRYAPGDSALTIDARLAEVGLVLPQLSGRLGLVGKASEAEDGWSVVMQATGPGDAVVSVDGTFSDLETDPAFAGRVSADIRDLSRYSRLAGRDLAGAVAAQATGSGSLSLERLDIDLSARSRDLAVGVPQADPLLRGAATLDLSASRDADTIEVRNFALQTPVLQAAGSGTARGQDGQLDLDLSLADTSLVYPQMSGPLTLAVSAAGEAGEWQVDLDASGPGSATVSVAGSLSDPFSGRPAFDGTIAAAVGDLQPYSQVAGRAIGGAVDLTVAGRVNTADLSYDVTLDGTSSNLRIGQPEAERLLAGTSTFSAAVRGKGTAVVVERLVVDTPQLDATVTGETDGEVISLSYNVALADLGLFAPGINGPLQAAGTARQEGDSWTVDLDATGPAGSGASIDGTVAADFSTANLGIDGQAPLALANRFITPNSVTGTLTFNLRLDGRPSLAALSGTVAVSGGRAVIIGPGLVLNDIGGNVVLQGERANVALSVAVQSGGRVTVDGPVELGAPFNANLIVRFLQVVFTDPNLYRTVVDGELAATGPLAGGATLAGTLNLDRTEIQIPSTGLGGTGPIPEITHLNEPAAVRATRDRAGLLDRGDDSGSRRGTGPRYPVDVRIVATNQIFIRGRGLDAELGGSLQLTGTTADLVPSGQFQLVRGRLDILGKRLVLEQGRARLQGNFTPFILLVASTETDGDVRVIITIEGEASNPTITFSSEPELPEDEILAQLLFGRGVQQISPLQAAQLASAVATLAGRGGGGIIGSLRENFGLDDLDVTTDTEGNAALRAGKYLSDNVYTDVTVGSDSTEINLNLDISRTVTATGTVSSDGETSIGIFFQRDY